MGSVTTIAHDRWPAQSTAMPPGTQLWVAFYYDFANMLRGTVVRNDTEPPYRMIIRLDDGRYIMDDECQYSEERPYSKDAPHAHHP